MTLYRTIPRIRTTLAGVAVAIPAALIIDTATGIEAMDWETLAIVPMIMVGALFLFDGPKQMRERLGAAPPPPSGALVSARSWHWYELTIFALVPLCGLVDGAAITASAIAAGLAAHQIWRLRVVREWERGRRVEVVEPSFGPRVFVRPL